MNNIALITIFFDYADFKMPSFYDNALKYFNKNDIHIIRCNNESVDGTIYDRISFHKIVKVHEYIKKEIIAKYDYILFMDGNDTNFYKEPYGLVEDFIKLNKSIVFCGEVVQWPFDREINELYNNKEKIGEAQFLNSGQYIGYTDKIILHLENIIAEYQNETGIDDQGRWVTEYLKTDDISVDQSRTFFFSTYDAKQHIEFNNDEIKLNNMSPYFIHDNGPDSENTIKIVEFFNGKKYKKTLM
jgi:hypothetical protein